MKSRGAVRWLAGRRSTLEEGHTGRPGSPPLPGPVPGPDAGRDKPSVVFKDVLSHHLRAKRQGLEVSEELQPASETMASRLFYPLLIRGQLQPLFLCRCPHFCAICPPCPPSPSFVLCGAPPFLAVAYSVPLFGSCRLIFLRRLRQHIHPEVS